MRTRDRRSIIERMHTPDFVKARARAVQKAFAQHIDREQPSYLWCREFVLKNLPPGRTEVGFKELDAKLSHEAKLVFWGVGQ